MEKFKLTGNLAVSVLDLEVQQAAPLPMNHVWIYDRSGSMGWTLDRLVEDLAARANTIRAGDFLTLAWFSGPGHRNIILKGYKVTGANDLEIIAAILQKNKRALDTTCFSEILTDVSQVITDLAILSDRFALVFFTDGCPVVPNVSKEVRGVEQALMAIKGKLVSSLMVGYGDYYNRQLMQEMAYWSGGALVHSDGLGEFYAELGRFIGAANQSKPAIKVSLPINRETGMDILPFYISGGNVIVLFGPEATVSMSDNARLYNVERFASNYKKASLETAYACALALQKSGYPGYCLEVLGEIGDKYLASKLSNAFTVSEIGEAEEALKAAIHEPGRRFITGKEIGCVPAKDAFCVVDALMLLAADKDAKFCPGYDDFHYKRIGKKSHPKEGYPRFEPDNTAACPMSGLVWNETRLNCNVKTRIPGKIKLDEHHAEYLFGEYFSTGVFRDFTIIKDGRLNVQVLPCSMSEGTYNVLLKNHAVSIGQNWAANRVYNIYLKDLPVMNRAMAEGKKSATKLCRALIDELQMEGRLKSLKYFYAKLDPEGTLKQPETFFTPDQITYLEGHGVVRGNFSPPVDVEEGHDKYIAKSFEVKCKGFSSFPKVDEVLAKRYDNKKQTLSGTMVLRGVDEYEAIQSSSGHLEAGGVAARTLGAIASCSENLRLLRGDIQKTKFAILLGNAWFDDLPRQENASLDVDGYTFVFNVKDVEVEL